LAQALTHTVDWHRAWTRGADMHAFSLHQIQAYVGADKS
jgi:CDP-glucose 4,6-dehydratase